MQALASSMGASFDEENDGIFWTWWDDSYALTKTRIFIAQDHLYDGELRPLLLEEVGQSLGPQNETSDYSESITYQSTESSHLSLSEIDQKLLRFLYAHVNSGEDDTAFESAFVQFWNQ
jgi:hypothetical protein